MFYLSFSYLKFYTFSNILKEVKGLVVCLLVFIETGMDDWQGIALAIIDNMLNEPHVLCMPGYKLWFTD